MFTLVKKKFFSSIFGKSNWNFMFVSINKRDIIEEMCVQPMNSAHVSFSPFQRNSQTVCKDLKAK